MTHSFQLKQSLSWRKGATDGVAVLAMTVCCVAHGASLKPSVVQEADLRAMNATSARFPRGTDEFLAANVAKAECLAIDCPRVADAPATLECRVVKLVDLLGDERLLLGEVVGVHLRDDCLVDGRFDATRFTPVARLGYHDYTFVREIVELRRP